MPEGKKDKLPNSPPAPSIKNAKVGTFTPGTFSNAGDIVVGDGSGWWVSVRGHVTGTAFTLQPGQSTDTWRWSTGPS